MKALQFLKKNINILICFIVVAVFIGVLGLCRLHQNKEWNDNQIYTEDMIRAQNVESLENPFEAAEYFMKAVLNKDIDKALRGCAIDEKCLNNDYKILMQRRAEEGADTDIAPSAEENCFYPVNAAIFAEEYNEQISILMEAIGKKQLKFKDVNYANISEMSVEKYKEEKQLKRSWGIKETAEVLVRLEEKDGTIYGAALTIAEYEYGWKVLETGSREIGLTYQNPIVKMDEKEYLKSIDKEKSKKEYKRSSKGKEDEENADIAIEDKILPLNYFMISQKGGKSINRMMESFTACMQRKDLMGAMNYIQLEENKEFFEAQRVVAEQMKDLCKGLMEIRDTNRNPRLWNAEELTYLGFNGVYDMDKADSDNKIVIYYYDGDFFAVGCRFVKADNLWKIQEFTEIEGANENKFVLKITKEELQQLQDFQNSDEETFYFNK